MNENLGKAIDAAIARPEWESPQALADLDALPPEISQLLEVRLHKFLPKLGEASIRDPLPLRVVRLTLALGRHLVRRGEPFPASLEPALRFVLGTGAYLNHMATPDAVLAAMKSVPPEWMEAFLTTGAWPPSSFWELLPARPTEKVVGRGVKIVLAWEKKYGSGEAATGAFVRAGAAALPGLVAGILGMDKQPWRAVLVDALATLPDGGIDALVKALGDSSAEVVGHARRGLVARKANAVPALDAALLGAKKASLKKILQEVRAEIGPVDVTTQKTAARNPVDKARASTSPVRVSAIREALAGDCRAHQAFYAEPEELLLAFLDLAVAQHQGSVQLPMHDATYEMHAVVSRFRELPLAAWCAVGALTRRREKIAGKPPARAQLHLYAGVLGDALRAPLVEALEAPAIAYPEVYYEWLAENAAPEAIPAFVLGLGGSKTTQGHCQTALVKLGEAGARAALGALDEKRKPTRMAAAEVLARVAAHGLAPELAEAVKRRVEEETDAAIRAKLDAALGAASAELI